MKSLRIDFNDNGAVLNTSSYVENFQTSTQAALVNMGTDKGTDRVFPNRGTSMFVEAVTGQLLDHNSAMHAANFAAIDTVFFIRETGSADLDEKIATIKMEPVEYDRNALSLNMVITSTLGNTFGVSQQISNG